MPTVSKQHHPPQPLALALGLVLTLTLVLALARVIGLTLSIGSSSGQFPNRPLGLPSPPVPTVSEPHHLPPVADLSMARWPQKTIWSATVPRFSVIAFRYYQLCSLFRNKAIENFSLSLNSILDGWSSLRCNQPVPIKISRHCLVSFQTEAAHQVIGDDEKE